ncbi:pentatricopeptide repeat-containing protein [Senna tora]|uniref:Pentatricopeptide repeat-containing protein n=1 Tax=Senna tora TaxID=362788 RepID=A0A834SKE0_9FABA|nr:pentatricopeptide repeat-containing protein [Senna tora]
MPEKNTVSWNTMITGYSRSGDIQKARSVFEEMPHRDVASWSAMIAAYTNYASYNEQAISLFRRMVFDGGVKPDEITASSVLSGCAHLGSLGLLAGKSIHGYIVKNGWDLSVELGTTLVNMYAKCGFLKFASQVFELMQERNVMSWTSLICGLAQHGYSEEALAIFEKMQIEGVKPNELAFTGVLSACVHTGLVTEGRRYFKMIERYGIEPRIQHYGCMVDLLGKAGKLEEAYEIIKTMKLEPNIVVWGSFLSACKEHRQFEMAERVIEKVLRMVKPEKNGGVYTLISDLYVLGDKWEEAEKLRKLMISENVRKVRGSSFVRSGL